jgi:hypothetical protein
MTTAAVILKEYELVKARITSCTRLRTDARELSRLYSLNEARVKKWLQDVKRGEATRFGCSNLPRAIPSQVIQRPQNPQPARRRPTQFPVPTQAAVYIANPNTVGLAVGGRKRHGEAIAAASKKQRVDANRCEHF